MPTIAELLHDGSPIRMKVEASDGDQLTKRFGQQMYRAGFPTTADYIKRNARAASTGRIEGIPKGFPVEDRKMLVDGFKRDALIDEAAKAGVILRVKMQ